MLSIPEEILPTCELQQYHTQKSIVLGQPQKCLSLIAGSQLTGGLGTAR